MWAGPLASVTPTKSGQVSRKELDRFLEGSDKCRACMGAVCKDDQAAFCGAHCESAQTSSACEGASQGYVICALATCYRECYGDSNGLGGASSTDTPVGDDNQGYAGDDEGTELGEGGKPSLGIGASNTYCYEADAGECLGTAVPDSFVELYAQNCVSAGGVSGPCPTAGLIGCCTLGTFEGCYYPGSEDPGTEARCTMSGGTWANIP